MSDVQKPVEEVPAAVPATETTEASTTTEASAEVPAAEETLATEEAAKPAEETKPEEAKEETKEEVKPATEGVLGHKAPGLIKSLRFSKRFFYFSDEPTESKNLSVFHQNEKPATANPTAAWATQTGKGLLFQTKRAEDKATPAGIFNLADVTDLAKEGSHEFIFKVAGQKHTFQAASAAERDSCEGYKAELEKLTKPAVVAPAAAAATTTTDKAEEPKEGEEAAKPAEETEAKAEEPKKEEAAPKSRSKSRQRFSIFGKKEAEKKEEKKPETKEETPAAAATAEETKPTETEVPAAEAAVEPAVVAPVAEDAAKPAEEEAKPAEEETKEETKKEEDKKEEQKKKRTSVFGSFFQKVTSPAHEKSEKEATAPAEETAVATSAPQLENPVEEADVKPIEPESVTAPAEGEAAKESAPETPAEATTPKDKRRTSFFGFGKKEKKADSDNEGTDSEAKEGKKGNKLGGLFRKPTNAKKVAADSKEETKEEDKKEETTEAPAAEAATEETPAVVAEEPKPAEATAAEETKNVEVPASTPVQAAA
ncbi:Pleckstrin homology domain-containing protein [Penicillium chermesinum]|nr:Pleckstrin homology domain-containing protein [Penicillium chermesinum]